MVYPTEQRRPSALPLMVAGAALVLAVWTLVERTGWLQPALKVETRVVAARGDLADFEKVTIKIFEDNKGSVAHITTNERLVRTWYGRDVIPGGTGSGFVWDAQGLVVTNYHVIAAHARDTIRVSFDGEHQSEARVLTYSAENDVAVLRLISPPAGLRPVLLGTSADLKVGQAAFAIGNPFGLDHTLSTGVISALDRTIRTENSTLSGMIQVDAAINPGNSGGPLFDSAGRLIGMNTAIYSPSGASAGLGFAVPVDTINTTVSQLLAGVAQPKVAQDTSAKLGVKGRSVQLGRFMNVARQPVGIAIVEVEEGSAAAEAGLRTFDEQGDTIGGDGDVILSVDGTRVSQVPELRATLANKKVGDKVRLRILRLATGRVADLTVELK